MDGVSRLLAFKAPPFIFSRLFTSPWSRRFRNSEAVPSRCSTDSLTRSTDSEEAAPTGPFRVDSSESVPHTPLQVGELVGAQREKKEKKKKKKEREK
jgi:hypothetical protein